MKKIYISSYRRQLLDKDLEASRQYIKGIVLDIGGGTERGNFKHHNSNWITLDRNGATKPDIIADAQHLPIKSGAINTVKCTEVIEYLENPNTAIEEMHRVLKPWGTVILSIPFNIGIHYDNDKVRFTRHGINKLVAGRFMPIVFKEQGMYFTVLCYMLKQAILNIKSKARWALYGTFPILDLITMLDECDFVKDSKFMSSFTTGYFLVGVKL